MSKKVYKTTGNPLLMLIQEKNIRTHAPFSSPQGGGDICIGGYKSKAQEKEKKM